MSVKSYYRKPIVMGVISLFVVLTIYLESCSKQEATPASSDATQLTNEELQGGVNGTINLSTSAAFAQPIPPMLTADVINFKVGRSFFHTNWVTAPASTQAVDGLGPVFNTSSCNSCHVEDGRGRTPFSGSEQLTSLLMRISSPGQDPHGGPNPDPDLGLQFRNNSILQATPDGEVYVTYTDQVVTYPDGSTVTLRVPAYQFKNLRNGHAVNFMSSPRIAPQLVGMGLLQAIPEATLLAGIDANDSNHDGITGKANYVWSVEKQQMVMGRFGWKANEPDIRQQVAGALSADVGITTPIYPNPSLYGIELTLFGSLINGSNVAGEAELPEPFFTNTVFYTEALAVPQRRNWTDATIVHGKALFAQVSCAKCHNPQFKTGTFADVPLLSNQTIHPYTDLLLHDMGTDLADGRTDYLASGSEWRTPPLWGIGLVSLVNNNNGMFLMHDGRARTIEEAILWHGGEAANSKQAFTKLSKADRDALIKFVNDL
ncbi:di-heme oxidoredictase family protein [Pedobacter sp. L105]|uniref:di-heme oxidoreductase family protein n=1 Tax=Pedobacter sp. L105 TaxID=1641871 RepID=UPI00131B29C9|nr:di-heme oxidoredictase family protein [Pedobacter sp. L105]